MNLPTPSVEYGLLSPMLIVFGVAVVGVLVEAFVPRERRYAARWCSASAGLIAAFVAVVRAGQRICTAPSVTPRCSARSPSTRPTLFLQGTILLVGGARHLLIAERRIPAPARRASPNAAVGGLDSFTPQASAVLGSVAEKLATKAGVGADRGVPADDVRDRRHAGVPGGQRSADDVRRAGGAVAAAVPDVRAGPQPPPAVAGSGDEVLSARRVFVGVLPVRRGDAVRLRRHTRPRRHRGRGGGRVGQDVARADRHRTAVVGVLFKVGAVPFHSWIPDVYQGAPTPITAFMAAATKIAAFGAMLRIFYVALPGLHDEWRPMMWAIAILTMVVGTVTAVTQTDVKRMLAYSSVAHTGFILTGVIAENQAGVSSTLFYLFAYSFSTVGAFAVVGLVRNPDGDEDTALARWAGLGRAIPLSAWCFRCSCSPSPASR